MLYILFFITQIHRVRFVSVNGRASRVKPSKNKFWKKLEKNFRKKILEKSFDKKTFGKINYKWKIFITQIYSNIDKCHTIFALLAPFDRTGRKTGSNENVCGIWFKIGSVARLHWTQVMWRFERSREKRYHHGLWAVGNSLTTWAVSASSVVRKILVRACPHDEAPEHWVPQKSRMLCINCRTVLRVGSIPTLHLKTFEQIFWTTWRKNSRKAQWQTQSRYLCHCAFLVSFHYAGSEKTWSNHFISISLALVTLPALLRR